MKFRTGTVSPRTSRSTTGASAPATARRRLSFTFRCNRPRFLADSTIGLLKNFRADTASRDVRLARVQAYAGYAYVLLAENMCSAPIGIGRAYSPDELLTIAVNRFKDAIATATAAKTYNTTLGAPSAK